MGNICLDNYSKGYSALGQEGEFFEDPIKIVETDPNYEFKENGFTQDYINSEDTIGLLADEAEHKSGPVFNRYVRFKKFVSKLLSFVND